MNDTQKNIKQYKASLPGLRERITASAMLLLVSLSMVISASFAWYTLSIAPEVSMINTTVAANGNLEIALAHGSVAEGQVAPDEVALGDSSSTEGQTVVLSNVTWGNLVNLSDASYGLNQISLRPALLSGYNLHVAPLYGATYAEDGRVEDISETYKYASWTEAEDGTFYFAAGDKTNYGVRAISSVTMSNVTGNAAINNLMSATRKAYASTTEMYLDLINGVTMVDETRNVSAMDGLAMLLEVFVNEKAESALKSGGDVYLDYQDTVTYTYRLLVEYLKILDSEGEALRLMANLQAFASGKAQNTNHFETVEDLRNASTTTIKNLGITLNSLTSYKANYTAILSAIAGMEPFAILHDPDNDQSTEVVYWPDKIVNDAGETVSVDGIGKHVSKLVNVNTTTANGVQMSKITVSNALTVISDPLKVVIHDGVLKDTEQRLGNMMGAKVTNGVNGTPVTIYISAMSLGTKTAYVRTSAEAPFLSNTDMGISGSMESTGGGDETGLDTYGLAVDLWVRTNVQDTILTLEGSTLYEEVEATCTNKNGEITPLYVASSATEGVVDVYFLDGTDEEGKTVTYVYDMISHTPIGIQTDMMTEEGGSYSFTRKINKVVSGYQGENRVWLDWEQMIQDQLLAENNTTQGAGSCYVFYANPSDQTRILELLKAFTIAFLDQDGAQVATAKLDTANAYDINGKATVPMKVVSGEPYIDEEGEEQIGIQILPRNRATWLTAVIYLDGMMLTNENVLDAGVIEGRLNFQFGSSVPITGAENGPLAQKYRIVSAVASYGDAVSNDRENPINFEYDGNAKNVTVTLTVEGDQPTNVTGFFIRTVGTSGGTRTEDQTFRPNDDGTWSATFPLTKPGEYVMYSVIADGSEYVLEMNPSVYIEGLSVTRVWTNPDGGMLMTADNFVDIDVEVVINADPELMPSQVRALFRSTDADKKEFTAVMSYDPNNEVWTGTARITASGTYVLEDLVMDGEYTRLEKDDDPTTIDQQKTFIVTLGMKASVSCTGILDVAGNAITTNNFKFESEEYDLAMRVQIYDDRGNAIENLDEVSLYYSMDGGGTDESGMKALNMVWDEATGYYTGNMIIANAGTYRFGRLEVLINGYPNVIRSAPNAPVFEAIPPEPPRVDLLNNSTADYQFVPNSSATMSVNMSYAQTADVWAVIRNVNNDQVKIVKSKSDQRTQVTDPMNANNTNYYRFDFTVPVNDQGTVYAGGNYQGFQDGEWYIEELWLQKVFDEELEFYPGTVTDSTQIPDREDCVVFTISNGKANSEERVYTDVVQRIFANVSKGTTKDYKGENFSGSFMNSYTVSGVKLEIFNWRKEPVKGISDVQLKLTHRGDSLAMGGYTSDTYMYPETQWTMTENGITYSAADQTFTLAGTYNAKLTYKVTVDGVTLDQAVDKIINFEIRSTTPTVAISGISNSNTVGATVTVDKTSDANGSHSSDTVPQWTSTWAKVFFVCSRSGSGGTCDPYRHNYTRPSVSITLTGIGSATNAELNFGSNVHIYNGTTQTTGYSWTADGNLARNIGYYRSNTASTDSKTAAGTLTATQLKLTYGGNTYTVTLPASIVIENPY